MMIITLDLINSNATFVNSFKIGKVGYLKNVFVLCNMSYFVLHWSASN